MKKIFTLFLFLSLSFNVLKEAKAFTAFAFHEMQAEAYVFPAALATLGILATTTEKKRNLRPLGIILIVGAMVLEQENQQLYTLKEVSPELALKAQLSINERESFEEEIHEINAIFTHLQVIGQTHGQQNLVDIFNEQSEVLSDDALSAIKKIMRVLLVDVYGLALE